MEEWYVGDGWYSDGPSFAFDYYCSYVFHPMYLETLQAMIDAKANTRLDYQKYYARGHIPRVRPQHSLPFGSYAAIGTDGMV